MLRLLTCALCLSAAAAAQPAGAPAVLAPTANPCAYSDCALRVEPRIFQGTQLLRGEEGERVGALGLFGSTLSRAVQDDEAALRSARRYETSRLPAVALVATGIVLAVASNAVLWDDFDILGPRNRRNETLGLAGFVVSAGLMVGGGVVTLRGQQAQSRAVWEYNRSLAERAP